VLSTWRTRSQPLEPGDRAVHQAILRSFAATGAPPSPCQLDHVSGGPENTGAALTNLHDADAIRLSPDGRIEVAYPFSTTPTRHRVRIGDRVDVYAMCAIDALGIAAMLGENTTISSVDVTTGRPVTVTTTRGHATWTPGGAVVFIGAAGGGPSADCCCDYLNFFGDMAAAEAWVADHQHIPGQVLNQAEAPELSARLFGPLLANREARQPHQSPFSRGECTSRS